MESPIQIHYQHAIVQRGFCASLLLEISKHATTNPNIAEQVRQLAKYIFDSQNEFNDEGQSREAPSINHTNIRERLFQLLNTNHQGSTFNQQELADLTYDLVNNPKYGLNSAHIIAHQKTPKPRRLTPQVQSPLTPERLNLKDTTVAKSPQTILTEYAYSVNNINQFPRHHRYLIAHDLLVEMRQHLDGWSVF